MTNIDFCIYLITSYYNIKRGLGYTHWVCLCTLDTKWPHRSIWDV